MAKNEQDHSAQRANMRPEKTCEGRITKTSQIFYSVAQFMNVHILKELAASNPKLKNLHSKKTVWLGPACPQP